MSAAMAMHDAIGIERAVLVQAGSSPFDAAAFSAQLRAAPGLRGVALVDDTTTDAELDALHDAGVRGVRFHFVSFLRRRPPLDVFYRTVDRAAARGWHVLLHVEPTELLELSEMIVRLRMPVVIDHCAHIRPAQGVQQPAFQGLLELHRLDHCWVKLSSADRWSVAGAPAYPDAVPLGRALIANAPERVLWATDWPHVMYKDPRAPGDEPPDAGHLLNLLLDIVEDDETLLRRVLVDNPARLYA